MNFYECCDLTKKVYLMHTVKALSQHIIYYTDKFEIGILDIVFPSNHNIHKSSYGLYFWASDPLIDRF